MASVKKRGNSYSITVSCGYNIHGKQIRQYKTWCPPQGMTERQIKRELLAKTAEFEQQCHLGVCGGDIKFEAFAEKWFVEYAAPNLKIRTISRYRQMTERVYRSIGHLKMQSITPRVISRFVLDLGRSGENKRSGKALSPKTIKNYLSFVSGIFSYAAAQGIVLDNPCRYVKAPPQIRPEQPCYTKEEAQTFLNELAFEPLCWQVYFNLAIFGGFRRGEIMGLEWGDIDFENNIITINRTSLYTSELGVFTDTPKTKSSRRSLKLPYAVIELIKRYKAQRPESVLSERLFIAKNGEPMNPTCVENWLERFLKRKGLRRVNTHSFRHLNATLLINSGADIKTVSAALGHSQISTTLNIYAHTIAQSQAKAADAIAEMMGISCK